MNFTATWYTPAGGVGDGLTTRSGLRVSEDLIAVDPSVIPLGSRVEIQYRDGRIERKIAADTGGAIRGNKVDIFTWDETNAIQNGRQAIKLRIVGYVKIG
ncbi:3D domain-containing protein [Ammoniphilus sp. 3BR4]|uniref:3D domain-containing protein n=1 Tax=Ammoniphilus sp. 3BR4 TaxID=3158265 RepID=UPI0034663241